MNPGETEHDAAVPQNRAMRQVVDNPRLPRVLLIGDSISIAYTLPVRRLLEGRANVHRVPANASSSAVGLSELRNSESWLGEKGWNVIHFNFGIHDAKLLPSSETPAVPLEEYRANLNEIVAILRATGAELIFATTTPVPRKLFPPDRRFDSIRMRNLVALSVMKIHGVEVNDLYTLVLPRQSELQRPLDLHFTPTGAQLLADAVAASIRRRLH